ncbi:hypothetical protein JD844_009175 [Phrynosoma platyrhinos]|uniref:Uncharacterized protein n=1 Tax=Phrynosoma platyrhinos TaxID=52577 RepID=A0ABQ7TFU9_PHRPL|nr:hypothetical protein JD844_009175 [Phrynosoma platyrhinos]
MSVNKEEQAEENKRRNKQKAQQARENEEISTETPSKQSNPKGAQDKEKGESGSKKEKGESGSKKEKGESGSKKEKGESGSKKETGPQQEERPSVANGNLPPYGRGGGGFAPPPHISVTRPLRPRGYDMNGPPGNPRFGGFQPRIPGGPPQRY